MTDPVRTRGLDLLPPDAWKAVNSAALAGQTLFITGATGFVGRWVLAAIDRVNKDLAKPLRVRALTRGERPVEAPWITWEKSDVRKFDVQARSDLILHAALPSTATPKGGDTALLETAIGGMAHVLRHAVTGGARRMIVLSSGSVYGTADGPLSESSPMAKLVPGDTYARAKREVEQMAFSPTLAGRAKVVAARLFTCIGHGYRNHGHLAHVSMIDDARAGRPIVLRSDGSALRSYLFGADLAVWILALLASDESDIVNVGSDEAISMLNFARTVARLAGRGEGAVDTRGTDPIVRPHFVPDITLARTKYQLAPWTNLESSIKQMLAAG